MSRYDVVVVGGGLVGTATAYELGRGGGRTLLCDRADAGRATDAGAGILSPETAKSDNPAWTDLVRAGGRYYDELLPSLDGDTGWARCGILTLATRATDVPAWEWVAERGGREISPADARAMVPVLGEIVRALHHADAARVDGRSMCAALQRAAIANGVEVRNESVDDVRTLDADAVVIAGGAWTPRVAAQLGVELPVVPMRGQIIHLDAPGMHTGTWPMVQPVLGHYMVPWADDHVAVGATVEDVGFATDVTAGGVHEVLRETLRVMPGLASATLREVRVGLRPWSADDFPILGAIPGTTNAFVATGHGANGLLCGPISGAAVADLILGKEPRLDLAPFSPARFRTMHETGGAP
jgi:D-amino-acid dehydrogenase